jgi:hypothetical protein
MKQQLEQRLKKIRAEYAAGQKALVNWKTSRHHLEKLFIEQTAQFRFLKRSYQRKTS